MKTLILLLTFISIQSLFGDVVLYDDPTSDQANYHTAIFASQKHALYTGALIDICSYNNHFSGVECIEGTSVPQSGSFSIVLAAGWIHPEEFTALVYHINQKQLGGARMNIHVYGGAKSDVQQGAQAMVGVQGSYGVQNIAGSWQTITVPISAFAFPAGTIVNRFSWHTVLQGTGYYVDYITLVGNGTIHYPNPYPPTTVP